MPTMTAEEIKELRAKRGWTQAELAQELGIHSSSITRWERGLYHPDRRADKRLKELAGETPAEEPAEAPEFPCGATIIVV